MGLVSTMTPEGGSLKLQGQEKDESYGTTHRDNKPCCEHSLTGLGLVSLGNFLCPKESGTWSPCLRTWVFSQTGLY